MIRQFTLLLLLAVAAWTVRAQTTIFSENFETGGSSFILNTTDMSSTSSGYNQFIVNNAYTGGTGSVMCLGFPFSYTVTNTPAQPVGISNGPNSMYLHTLSSAAIADNIFCSTFHASDGFCFFDENYFAKMASDVSTSAYDSVELSFWWHCGGGSASTYGEVYYSTNGGTSWTLVSTPISQYWNQTTWTQTKISLPAFAGNANFRIGFRFVNVTATSVTDPGFGIDDFQLTGWVSNDTITTDSVSSLALCQGDSIEVFYTASGTFTGVNNFTVQISDASGSFMSPLAIGQIMSTSSGSGSIMAAIPGGLPTGSNYRVRVISSSPALVGSDNGQNITINPQPWAGSTMTANDSVCVGTMASVTLTGNIGAIVDWMVSTDSVNFTSTGMISSMINYGPITTDTWFMAIVTNSCGSDSGVPFKITAVPAPVAGFSHNSTGLQVNFTDASTGATSWDWDFGDGNNDNVQNPTHTYTSGGNYPVTLIVTNAFGCADTLTDTVNVMPVGITEDLAAAGLKVWPNPVADHVNIHMPASGKVEIFDLRLQRLAVYDLREGDHELALPELVSGMYLMRIESGGETYSVKLLRE